MKRLQVVTALLIVVGALGMVLASGGGALKPMHVVHHEQDIDCETCHEAAWTSQAATDNLLPEKEVCADCHDVEDAEECGLCHVDVDDPQGYSHGSVVAQLFPHATHVEGGMSCADCHGKATQEPVLPEKPQCRGCHATVSGYEDCRVCHARDEELVPASHTPEWISFHGIDAGWDQGACETCHTQTDCQDCHAGDNVRPRSHPLGYVFNHALEARANEILCITCHEDQSYCTSCHIAEGVVPQNHSRSDWRFGGAHGEEALFNMESCVACHDAGTDDPSCVGSGCHVP